MRYLSHEWILAADASLRAATSSAPAGRVVIDQVVEGMAKYRVVIDRDDSSIALLDDSADRADADACFSQSADTAIAVARGITDAHQAFLLGHIRFDGDVTVLIEQRDAFEWLASVLAPVLAQTEFA